MERKNGYEIWDEKKIKDVFDYCENYKKFLTENKIVRKFIESCIEQSKRFGFKELGRYERLNKGDRFFKVNKGREVIFGIIGEKKLTEGCRFIVAHVDCPRIDLKTTPLYEDENIALFKTYYYGGIKKYQWLTIPLSLVGYVFLKDGSVKEIEIGEKEDDPVLTITDLLPHLAKEQYKKSIEEGFPGENLNVFVGTIPDKSKDKEKVKNNILKILKENYRIEEDDLLSAELEIVPSGKAKDAGFDRSMILAYGQDDRVCSYTSFTALLNSNDSVNNIFCILVDQEEIGSRGSTSASSSFFEYLIEELLEKSGYSITEKRKLFENSKAISGDVNTLFDPNYKDAYEPKNAAKINCGVVLTKITGARGKSGSTEPTGEYIAYIRNIFDKNKVLWQPGEIGKLELGGGGTVASYFARYNIDTIDCGTGVLSMHAPFELTGKIDVYSTFEAYKVFYLED
ncbi:MAG: aminopeptidase [Candidatus Omnitrophica bacterium]|nr:aminopeptidase [Candidatus Omnitrophota bacterium]MCM8802573.1 aminopeptidase [Candidatus Omnitrophota bacterium]